MEAKIQEMDERLIARINTTSRDFQTQINTVLQERVDEEGIAAKAFDKVQGFFGKDFKDKMTALDQRSGQQISRLQSVVDGLVAKIDKIGGSQNLSEVAH